MMYDNSAGRPTSGIQLFVDGRLQLGLYIIILIRNMPSLRTLHHKENKRLQFVLFIS